MPYSIRVPAAMLAMLLATMMVLPASISAQATISGPVETLQD